MALYPEARRWYRAPVDTEQLMLVFNEHRGVISRVAKTLHMHENTVIRHLVLLDVYTTVSRSEYQNQRRERRDEFAAQCELLLLELSTAQAVADKLKCSPSTVCKALKRRGHHGLRIGRPAVQTNPEAEELALQAWEREPITKELRPIHADWRCGECRAIVVAGNAECPKGHTAPYLRAVA